MELCPGRSLKEKVSKHQEATLTAESVCDPGTLRREPAYAGLHQWQNLRLCAQWQLLAREASRCLHHAISGAWAGRRGLH